MLTTTITTTTATTATATTTITSTTTTTTTTTTTVPDRHAAVPSQALRSQAIARKLLSRANTISP